VSFRKPSVTADVIVKENGKVLLVKRKRAPFKGCWALPGGFLEVGRETVKQAAQRELKEETGLVVELEDLELIGESSNPNRDPRGHVVSLHYFVKRYSEKPNAGDDAAEVRWFPCDNLPKLAFDHKEILDKFPGGENEILKRLELV